MTTTNTRTAKPNWFPTLNDALGAEGLVELWPLGRNVQYGETAEVVSEGLLISVYRDERGFYERPLTIPLEDGRAWLN